MKFLLDTNALLFWLAGSKRITTKLRTTLANPDHRVFVSSVSTFEIAVKASLERLRLPDSPRNVLPEFLARAGLTHLPLTVDHSLGVFDLPWHHNDPFDRLLIAQALCEDLTLVSSDRMMATYPVKLLPIA
ncbi:MAG: type II toxin-antitoxin system VapC family toxin [Vulcanimicrobiaceae bacterium]